MAKHVLIVGAGIIGLSVAYHAVKRGMRVTIVERGPPERDGCSFGNAGLIVPSHFVPLAAPGMVALGLKWMWNPESPFYIKPRLSWDLWSWCWRFWRAANRQHVERCAPLLRDLHLASRACYAEWADASQNAFGLEKRGLLILCKTAHTLNEEATTAAAANRLGIPAEVLDARRTAELDPGVRMDIAGSIYFPMDCHLSPNRLMAWLQREVERPLTPNPSPPEGRGEICWQTEVIGWRTRGRRIEGIMTNKGEFQADEYVLCGGSWSSALARDLRLTLPLQAGKGYSLTLPQPCTLPRIGAILSEARIAVTPMGSSLRFGGTMEIAGLHERIDPRRIQGIIKSASQYYPDFAPSDFAGIEPWCGLRPCSPDGVPYLGRTKAYDNLIVATGHAMMGVSLGPITGRLVAELLADEKPTLDLGLLSPDRFA